MVEWISHRGVRYGCAENTLKAFSLAREAGFTWLETDLRCSADGVIVLAHDSWLGRVFGSELTVEASSFRDLAKLVSAEGDALLSFDDFMRGFADLKWVLDIKPESAERVITALSSDKYRSVLIERIERIRFLFWDGAVQAKFLAAFPEAQCFARQSECWRAGLSALLHVPFLGGIRSQKTYAVPPSLNGIDLYSTAMFARFKNKGAKVLAYLPDTKEQAENAIAAGADFILSNEPLMDI